MRVRELVVSGLVGLRDGRFVLPDKGVVLVTGPNGHGKSSIIDAIAFGLYGEAPRGLSPFSPEADSGEIRVGLSDGTIAVRTFRRRGGKVVYGFTWGATQYESPTIAQEAFCARYGSYDSWVGSSVLTPASVVAFTGAQDADRKALVESILRLPDFGTALTSVNKARSAAQLALGNGTNRRTLLAEELVRLRDQLAGIPEESVARVAARAALETAKNSQGAFEAAKRALDTEAKKLQEIQAEDRALASALQRERAKAEMIRDTCPTCGTALDARAAHDAARALVEAAATAYAQRRTWTAADEAQRVSLASLCTASEAQYRQDHAAFQDAKARLTLAEQMIPTRKRIQEIEAELPQIEVQAASAAVELKNLEMLAEAFGVRGIRTTVLAGALRTLSDTTNLWLSKIAPELTIDISLTSSKQGGAERITILRPDTKAPYRALSAGQRRAVDLAVMFALGQITSAASGADPGTMILDECLDALDSEHVARMCEVASILGESRCVVVITHSAEAERSLSPVKHLRMFNGAPA